MQAEIPNQQAYHHMTEKVGWRHGKDSGLLWILILDRFLEGNTQTRYLHRYHDMHQVLQTLFLNQTMLKLQQWKNMVLAYRLVLPSLRHASSYVYVPLNIKIPKTVPGPSTIHNSGLKKGKKWVDWSGNGPINFQVFRMIYFRKKDESGTIYFSHKRQATGPRQS